MQRAGFIVNHPSTHRECANQSTNQETRKAGKNWAGCVDPFSKSSLNEVFLCYRDGRRLDARSGVAGAGITGRKAQAIHLRPAPRTSFVCRRELDRARQGCVAAPFCSIPRRSQNRTADSCWKDVGAGRQNFWHRNIPSERRSCGSKLYGRRSRGCRRANDGRVAPVQRCARASESLTCSSEGGSARSAGEAARRESAGEAVRREAVASFGFSSVSSWSCSHALHCMFSFHMVMPE